MRYKKAPSRANIQNSLNKKIYFVNRYNKKYNGTTNVVKKSSCIHFILIKTLNKIVL